jgi:starvation-inducible DNA-binding protein
MEISIGIAPHGRQAVSDGLAKLLAEAYTLYLKTQNFHWNVQGVEFYSLHLLFEKQYEELAAANDEIAERIRALGFYVDATFASFLQHSAVKESHKLLSAKEMLKDLADSHEIVIRKMRQVCDLAEKELDGGTVDLLGRRMGAHEKMAWMLRSSV